MMAHQHASNAALMAAERERLILRYAPLVRHAVGAVLRSTPTRLDVEDLYSYGMMGLIDAIDRFDATRGVKFETYALIRIRGYVLDQLRAYDWLPRSARAQVSAVQRTSRSLEERLGRRPDRRELAAETGLTTAACERALAAGSRVVLSLDRLLTEGEDSPYVTLLQRLEDERSANPLLLSERADLRRSLLAALAALPERERRLLLLHYKRGWALRRVAGELGVSESRASQLHNQALGRLRRTLSPSLGTPCDGQARCAQTAAG
jgi:RNA polymerase sigma factor for flagellar operon FliA